MTLEECYNAFGGNYRDVLKRLVKEDRVERFIKGFPDQNLVAPIEKYISEKNYKQAFLDAHNLKGLCATLGISRLFKSVSALTECLRPTHDDKEPLGNPEELLKNVLDDYNLTVETIHML